MLLPLVRRALDPLASLLAPPACAACDAPTHEAFCNRCAFQPARELWTFERMALLTAGLYQPPLQTALRRLKYESRPDLARPIGLLLADAIHAAPSLHFDTLVPVPLHRSRLAERGYNQAALLAREVARREGVELAPLALARHRDGPAQAVSDRRARFSNVRGAFSGRQPHGLRGRHVAIVDDVVTTGATALACAQAARAAGAATCAILAVARASGGPNDSSKNGRSVGSRG